MEDFFKSIKFKILLGIVALLVGIMLYSANKAGTATEISEFFSGIFQPVKNLSTSISTKVEQNLDKFTNAQNYYDENAKLKEQIGELYNQMKDYEKIKTENEELKKFIKVKDDNPEFELSPPCNLTSYVTNNPYGMFVIDRGSKDGIALYDPVVTAEGVVGIIAEVGNNHAVVETILSPNVSFGATSVQTNEIGVVEGSVSLAKKRQCKLVYLEKDNKLEDGNIIVTGGTGGKFPKGLTIGTITDKGLEDTGLSGYAVIEPIVEIDRLTSVIVITSFNSSGEVDED